MVKLALILIINCLSFLGYNREKAAYTDLYILRVENNLKISNTNLTFETGTLKIVSFKKMINSEQYMTDIKEYYKHRK